MRQEVGAVLLAAQREHRARDLLIAQALQAKQAASEVGVRNGFDVEDEDVHLRAAVISAFISRTASPRPVNSARATIAWPMFSSTISWMAATGCTLW